MTQLPIHDVAPDVPLRSFTLRFVYILWKIWMVNIYYIHREDVRAAENEYEIGTTQMNFTDEVSKYASILW